MSRIGVGIVGLSARGGWAARAHLPALKSLSDRFTVTAVAASSMARARMAAETFAIPHAAASAEELAAHPDVDLVVVAVKVPHHDALVGAALRARKMVLCEWPLAIDEGEAARLHSLQAATHVRAFVGLQARSASTVRHVKRLVEERVVGDVLSIDILAAVGMPWDGTTDSSRIYLNRRESGASLLTIPFGHCFDAFGWIFGEFAKTSATFGIARPQVLVSDTGERIRTDVADQVLVGGMLRSGAVASLHYRGGLSSSCNFRWIVNGTDGDILIEGGDGHLQYGLVEIAVARGRGAPFEPEAIPGCDVESALPPHARAVANQYRAIHQEIVGGGAVLPGFAEALDLHRKLAALERIAGKYQT